MKKKRGRGRSKGYWFWAARNVWVHSNGTKRVVLCDGPKTKETAALAKAAFHQLMASPVPEPVAVAPGVLTCSLLSARFLANRKLAGVAPSTLQGHTDCLRWFNEQFGSDAVASLTPVAVLSWLGKKTWASGTKKRVSASVVAMTRWASHSKPRLIADDPLSDFKFKGNSRREFVFDEKLIAKVLNLASPDFSKFFGAVLGTGSRPSEIAKLEARHLTVDEEAGCVVAVLGPDEWKAGKATGKSRTIYFLDSLGELVVELAAANPTGPLFRCEGIAWNRLSWSKELRSIRAELGLGKLRGKLVVYAARSTFLTRASNRPGANLVKIAEVTGTSLKMLQEHYLVHSRKDYADELRRIKG